MKEKKICPFRVIAHSVRFTRTECIEDACAWWREYFFNERDCRSEGCCAVLDATLSLDSLKGGLGL